MTVRLVGREPELRHADAVLSAVAGGAGRVLLVSGDAGIGKSRLAAEVIASARDRGFVTLQGNAHPLHAGLAYAPLVEALGPYLRGLDPARRDDVLSGLTNLGRLFPGLHLSAAEPLGDAALERTRLFEGVARLMAAVARSKPVLLFIDDLHWADQSTVELMHYLGRSVSDRKVLLLVTLRGSELGTATPLGEFVRSMTRAEMAEEMCLRPLSSTAVLDLLRERLDADPPPQLLDTVTVRAAGVPLFVLALVEQLIETGDLARGGAGWTLDPGAVAMLPTIVRDLVLSRLTRLGREDRRLLELIAVAGDAANADLLGAMWPEDDQQIGESLRKLVADRLIVEREVAGTIRCQVAHPLYAEVAYAEMTELARRRTHAEIACLLERRRPDDVVALAPHYHGAADMLDPRRTMRVLAAAGKRALDLHADAEAARYLDTAASWARRLGERRAVPELMDALGEARERTGQPESAARAWRDAISVAQEQGAARTVGKLHHRLALLEWNRGNTGLAEEHLATAQTVDPGSDASELCIRLMLLSRRWGDAHWGAAAQLAEFAERNPGSPMAGITADMVRAHIAFHNDDMTGARSYCARILRLAEQSDAILQMGSALRIIVLATATIGELRAARDHSLQHLEIAHRLGIPTVECSARVTLASIHYLTGDWAAARTETETTIALARRSASARGLAGGLFWRAVLLARQGRLAEARTWVDEAEQAYGPGLAGDRNIATGLALARALAHGPAGGSPAPPEDMPVNTAVTPIANLLLLADARLAGGDTDGVRAIITRLRAIDRGVAPLPSALADRLAGQLASRNGEELEAARLLGSAAERLGVLGLTVETAVARLEWCETVAGTRAGEATGGATACLAEFERVGARPLADRTCRLLRTLGVRTSARPGSGVLSEREREVAGLVAEGLSNAEIAARLFLSVRTVETHLRHVYARLDLDSRVALARWVTEHDNNAAAT